MTHSREWLLPAAVIALVFGLSPPDPNLTGEPLPLPNDYTILAAEEPQSNKQSQVQSEESADESAKMGEETGTHTGDEAATPETDIKKVDQPPRQNPTTSN
jgi:hypothetical protein